MGEENRAAGRRLDKKKVGKPEGRPKTSDGGASFALSEEGKNGRVRAGQMKKKVGTTKRGVPYPDQSECEGRISPLFLTKQGEQGSPTQHSTKRECVRTKKSERGNTSADERNDNLPTTSSKMRGGYDG